MPYSSCVASGVELRAGLQYTPGAFLQGIKQLPYQDDVISVPFITVLGWASEERGIEGDLVGL